MQKADTTHVTVFPTRKRLKYNLPKVMFARRAKWPKVTDGVCLAARPPRKAAAKKCKHTPTHERPPEISTRLIAVIESMGLSFVQYYYMHVQTKRAGEKPRTLVSRRRRHVFVHYAPRCAAERAPRVRDLSVDRTLESAAIIYLRREKERAF